MRLGACVGMDKNKLAIVKASGYDYAESSAGSIANASEEDYNAFLEEAQRVDIPVEVVNGFVPGDIRLVGAERDTNIISDYLNNRLMPRLAKLGIKVIVFGSSGARRVPEGMSKEEAFGYLVDFLKTYAGPAAAKYGMSIAIEPLCSKEDNAVNSVKYGVEIVNAVNLPNVKVLADLYHMVMDNEGFEYLKSLKGVLLHAHTSTPTGGEGRRVYMLPDDGYSQIPFMSAVCAAECPRCSVEAGTKDFAHDAPLTYEIMKKALDFCTK